MSFLLKAALGTRGMHLFFHQKMHVYLIIVYLLLLLLLMLLLLFMLLLLLISLWMLLIFVVFVVAVVLYVEADVGVTSNIVAVVAPDVAVVPAVAVFVSWEI